MEHATDNEIWFALCALELNLDVSLLLVVLYKGLEVLSTVEDLHEHKASVSRCPRTAQLWRYDVERSSGRM